jgi:capsular polysaccharide transport system permease protein
MSRFTTGWNIQARVISALMVRELVTRFGRENIGFLWIMVEPLLFASLVSVVWSLSRGSEENGLSIVAFVVTGYLPLTLFRHAVTRVLNLFIANGSLLYHRQIKLLDLIFVRLFLEMIGCLMAYVFVAVILMYFGLFPVPADMGYLLGGWLMYCYFVLSLCLIIAPLSSVSELLEKILPVTTYIMLPVSGSFTMQSWLTPTARDVTAWSPMVSAMEMMRYGVFGDSVTPYYTVFWPLAMSSVLTALGLAICRKVRRNLVVE